jgi:hypothetical protein
MQKNMRCISCLGGLAKIIQKVINAPQDDIIEETINGKTLNVVDQNSVSKTIPSNAVLRSPEAPFIVNQNFNRA